MRAKHELILAQALVDSNEACAVLSDGARFSRSGGAQLQPDDADNNQGHADETGRTGGLSQQDDSQKHGADGTDNGVKFDFTFPGADIPDLSFPTFDNEKKEQ